MYNCVCVGLDWDRVIFVFFMFRQSHFDRGKGRQQHLLHVFWYLFHIIKQHFFPNAHLLVTYFHLLVTYCHLIVTYCHLLVTYCHLWVTYKANTEMTIVFFRQTDQLNITFIRDRFNNKTLSMWMNILPWVYPSICWFILSVLINASM